MAAPATSEEFLDWCAVPGLPTDALDAWLARQTGGRTPRDSKALAVALVRDSILTEFQAKQLLVGKPENLVLGKYEVVDLLGSGTMSTVFLCRHPAMDRWVAVKLLSNTKATNPQMLRRFHREARAAATLCHPNIVHAFDFVEDERACSWS
jgi:serine/threonine-protein kinase